MTARYLLGVDLGTSATKAALYDTHGILMAEASQEVAIHHPEPGMVEQDQDDFYLGAAAAVRACLQESGIDPRQIVSLAFDSQMAGLGSVDDHYRPAAAFDSWLDMRCQPYIQEINARCGDMVTAISGCPPTCDHGPKMLWWEHEQPGRYARVAKFLMPAAYVAGRMAELEAEQAYIDPTFLHFSGLADGQTGTWSAALIDALGVDRRRLPRIVPPWQIVGEVRDRAAADFGLAPGTPIAAGAGDTAAGSLGAGITVAGMLCDTAGTASVLAGTTSHFVADVKHRALLCMRSVLPGLWHPLAYVAGGGLALNWFREQFGLAGEGGFEAMVERAMTVPEGADGLLFSPHLGGRICPSEPAMRGAWVGFSWGHTRDHFVRAMLESVAFEYRFYLRVLRELAPGQPNMAARVIGGGARSAGWNQLKADVLGVPYQRLRRQEFATWGSALIAGHAVGQFPNLAEAAADHAVREGLPIDPRPEATRRYQPAADAYLSWQENLARACQGTPDKQQVEQP
jgi:xylulokinase